MQPSFAGNRVMFAVDSFAEQMGVFAAQTVYFLPQPNASRAIKSS